jgi:hypothetical protein
MSTYLTGASNQYVRAIAIDEGIGILLRPGNSYHLHVDDFACWAADNGQYTKKPNSAPTDAEWLSWLESATAELDRNTCLFATAPDVLTVIDIDGEAVVVGDAAATLERSRPLFAKIRALGLPAALVAQDGLEDLEVPWDEFDVLFIGGSTEWKVGPGAARLIAEAQIRGKGVHVGRVNSGKRYTYCADLGVDSVDGTYLAYGPEKNLPNLVKWVRSRPRPTAPSWRFGRISVGTAPAAAMA